MSVMDARMNVDHRSNDADTGKK